MSLDNLVQNSLLKGDPGPAFSGAADAYSSGVNLGVDIAVKRKQLEVQNEAIKNTAIESAHKRSDYLFNYIRSVDNQEEGPLKKAMLDQLPKIFQTATGEKIDADNPLIVSLSKSPGMISRIADVSKKLDEQFPGSGKKLEFAAQLSAASRAGDLGEAIKHVDDLVKANEELTKTKAVFGNKIGLQDVRNAGIDAERASKLQAGTPEDILLLRNPQNAIDHPEEFQAARQRITTALQSVALPSSSAKQEDLSKYAGQDEFLLKAYRGDMGPDAKKESQLVLEKRRNQERDVQIKERSKLAKVLTDPEDIRNFFDESNPDKQQEATQKALKLQADQAKSTFDLKQENTRDTINARKQKIAQGDARLQIQYQRLTLSQQNQAIALNKELTKNKVLDDAFTDVSRAQRGLTLLNKGNVKWIDLSEAASDLNRIITGSSRVAQSQQDKIDFKSLERTWETWLGKAQNHEVGGPSPEEIQLFRDRLSRLGNVIAQTHDRKLNQILNLQTLSGLRSSGYNQSAFEEYKLSGETSYVPPGRGGQPAPGKSQGQKMRPAEIDLETKRANNAIGLIRSGKAQGMTEDQVRKKYKMKTGKDLP